MRRKTFDTLVSIGGLILAAVLAVAGGLLLWSSSFINGQVHDQLAAQQIYFPAAGSDAIKGPEFTAMQQYAGQQLTTGAQAEVYADHFIAVHLQEIGGGKTYSQLSAAAQADPTNTQLQSQVATMFKGETLRGMLLNAYAFGKMGSIAGIAAIVSFVSAGVLLVLSIFGLVHARRTPAEVQLGAHSPAPVEPKLAI
jgi:hypothetical protein